MFCLCVKTHEVGACDLNDKVKIFLKIRFCLHRLVVFFLPCKELFSKAYIFNIELKASRIFSKFLKFEI